MEEKYLVDICNPKQWKTIPKSELIEDGEFPVYGANGIIGRYNKYNHEKPTVLITCRGATCGNIHITVPKSYINGNAMSLDDLNESKCKKEYLYYFLKYYDLSKIISGTAQPQITINGLKKVKVKLYSIEKQEKIVDELNKINKVISLKKSQLEELSSFIKSQFVEMFGDIKIYKRLSDYSILITKGASPKWQGINYKRKGTLFITSENVREGYIDISKPKYLENKINEILPRSILRKEDILINIVGASIGRAAKYNYEYLANINQAVALVRTKNINNIFLLTYLNSEQAIKMYNDMKKGGARENLSLKNISDLKIPKATLALQNQFSEIVKQIDKQKFESMIQLKMMEKIYNIINDRRRYV